MIKKIEPVKVSFMSILQARFLLEGSPLATQIDEWIESIISFNKSKIIKRLLLGFNKFEKSTHSNNIIEFELDSLDKNLILFESKLCCTF